MTSTPDPLAQSHELLKARLASRHTDSPVAKVNLTQASGGGNQVDSERADEAIEESARVIPGTSTVQSPALPKGPTEEASDELNEKLRAAREHSAEVAKSIAARLYPGGRK